jgi:hypothetical protein
MSRVVEVGIAATTTVVEPRSVDEMVQVPGRFGVQGSPPNPTLLIAVCPENEVPPASENETVVTLFRNFGALRITCCCTPTNPFGVATKAAAGTGAALAVLMPVLMPAPATRASEATAAVRSRDFKGSLRVDKSHNVPDLGPV